MKRADMVRRGTDQLMASERAIDTALYETATLVSELTRMRLESNLSAVVGQEALESASEAIARLTEARKAIVLTHHNLAVVRDDLNSATVAAGTDVEKPPKNHAGLRRVANAR